MEQMGSGLQTCKVGTRGQPLKMEKRVVIDQNSLLKG